MIGICENECFLSPKKKALDSILVRTNALDIQPHFPYKIALLGQVRDLEPWESRPAFNWVMRLAWDTEIQERRLCFCLILFSVPRDSCLDESGLWKHWCLWGFSWTANDTPSWRYQSCTFSVSSMNLSVFSQPFERFLAPVSLINSCFRLIAYAEIVLRRYIVWPRQPSLELKVFVLKGPLLYTYTLRFLVLCIYYNYHISSLKRHSDCSFFL